MLFKIMAYYIVYFLPKDYKICLDCLKYDRDDVRLLRVCSRAPTLISILEYYILSVPYKC
jgi:hypothetical protein